MRLMIPDLKLESESNAHAHWRHRAKRAKAQREAVVAAVIDAGLAVRQEFYLRQRKGKKQCVRHRLASPPDLPLAVLIVRCSTRSLDPGGNLQTSGKHVQDQLAELLGIDDRDPRVSYFVAQRVASSSYVDVRVEARCQDDRCRAAGPCSALLGACILARLAAEQAS